MLGAISMGVNTNFFKGQTFLDFQRRQRPLKCTQDTKKALKIANFKIQGTSAPLPPPRMPIAVKFCLKVEQFSSFSGCAMPSMPTAPCSGSTAVSTLATPSSARGRLENLSQPVSKSPTTNPSFLMNEPFDAKEETFHFKATNPSL